MEGIQKILKRGVIIFMRKLRKLISLTLTIIFIITNLPMQVFAAYNGNSSVGSGTVNSGSGSGNGSGNGGRPLINGLDVNGQFFKFSLYFLPMGSDLLGTENTEVRNQYWIDNVSSAMQVGKTILVSRQGSAYGNYKASGYFTGNIFSAYGQGVNYSPRVVTDDIFVKASDIGLKGSDFPIYMSSLGNSTVAGGIGLSTHEYFMEDNDAYVEGVSPEYLPTDNMKNLIRYIAGTEGGYARVSFSDDSDTMTVGGVTYAKNPDSIFDYGTYNGVTGEYKLFIEAGVVANGIAYTLRELVADDNQNNQQSALVYNLANNFLGAMKGVSLDDKDILGLVPYNSSQHDLSTTQKWLDAFDLSTRATLITKGHIGIGLNILSSELFRTPTNRTIGMHTNIFLNTENAVSFEFVGAGQELNITANEIGEYASTVEITEIYSSISSQSTVTTGYTLPYVLTEYLKTLLKSNLNATGNTNTGNTLKLATMLATYSNSYDKEGVSPLDVDNSTFDNTTNTKLHGVQFVDSVNTVTSTNGRLTTEIENALKSNAYVIADNDYVSNLSNATNGNTLVPIASGTTILKVHQDGDINQSVELVKGIIKDIIDEVGDNLAPVLSEEITTLSASQNLGKPGRTLSDTNDFLELLTRITGYGANSNNPTGYWESLHLSPVDTVFPTSRWSFTARNNANALTIVNETNTSYGEEVNGVINDISVNPYAVTSLMETVLDIYSNNYVTLGNSIIPLDSISGYSYLGTDTTATQTRLASATITPYRVYGASALRNDGTLTTLSGSVIEDLLDKEITTLSKKLGADINSSEVVSKIYSSTVIASPNLTSESKSQAEIVQEASNIMLNSVLPSNLSEVTDTDFHKYNVNGNYGVSWIIWDEGIPVDLIITTETSDGLKVMVDADGNPAIITDVYAVAPNMESLLSVPAQVELEQANGTTLTFTSESAIIKPSTVSIDDFIEAYNNREDEEVLYFDNIRSNIVSAPFTWDSDGKARTVQNTSSNSTTDLAGSLTNFLASGKSSFDGLISVVPSSSDRNGRMALVLKVSTNTSSITQYNVVTTVTSDGTPISSEVYEVTPNIVDQVVLLEDTFKDGTLTGWKVSETDKKPTSWDDTNQLTVTQSGFNNQITNTNKNETVYVHYIKQSQDVDLYLTEKRITWAKNLIDLGGKPTLEFTVKEYQGHTHDVYDDNGNKVDTVTYNWQVGSDSTVRLLASNIATLNEKVVGTVGNFSPQDATANEKSNVNLSNSSLNSDPNTVIGSLTPNYHFTLFRGYDIPTIAQYKYEDSVNQELKDRVTELQTLIGTSGTIARYHNSTSGVSALRSLSSYLSHLQITMSDVNFLEKHQDKFFEVYKTTSKEVANSLFESDLADYENMVIDELPSLQQRVTDLQEEYAQDKKGASAGGYKVDHEWWANVIQEAKDDVEECKERIANLKAKLNSLFGDSGDVQANNYLATLPGHYYGKSGNSYHSTETSYDHISGDSETYNANITVDVYYGEANVSEVRNQVQSGNFVGTDGTVWNNAQGNVLHNAIPIRFTPYVEMYYDTTTTNEKNTGTTKSIYVLGGHNSSMVANDYIEIGFNTYGDGQHQTGLVLESTQWSTHATAVNNYGKNLVLPGGAIYTLTTPNSSGSGTSRTKIMVNQWLTVVPDDLLQNLVDEEARTYYSVEAQQQRADDLYRTIAKSLNSLDIVQYVNGQAILQQGFTGTTPSGQALSQDSKYWLQQGIQDGNADTSSWAGVSAMTSTVSNEADLDITARSNDKITAYRVYADTNGNVTVKKAVASGTSSSEAVANTAPTVQGQTWSITKEQGVADLLAQSSELAELDNKTKVITNFINALDRNQGNERSLEGTDQQWYNEAWDGICVVRIEREFEVGFNDNAVGSATRTAALDPKLTPVKQNQSDLYSTAVDSYFGTLSHTNYSTLDNYVGTMQGNYVGGTGVQIFMGDMTKIYKSKVFKIPNATVMDLY